MANLKSAIKRVRQNEKRRQHNASLRSRMRTHLKRALTAAAKGDDTLLSSHRQAVSAVDVAASKGLIHKNKANRHKRRLNARVQSALGN